jgi:hypothetical protein
MADAIHISKKKGERATHVVGVGDLKVMILRDGNREWYAQGLEIDYIAQGSSMEAAKTAFERGLTATIELHLRNYGTIRKLLKVAPPEVWEEFYQRATSTYGFNQITQHDLACVGEDQTLVATTTPKRKGAKKSGRKKPVRAEKKAAGQSRIAQLPFQRITYLSEAA